LFTIFGKIIAYLYGLIFYYYFCVIFGPVVQVILIIGIYFILIWFFIFALAFVLGKIITPLLIAFKKLSRLSIL